MIISQTSLERVSFPLFRPRRFSLYCFAQLPCPQAGIKRDHDQELF